MPHVWMALDPETFRVTMQDSEFSEGDFPPGLRGLDWPIREGEVSEEDWLGINSGRYSGDLVNDIHRDTWTASGDAAWPNR